jgi:hypothetical protein
VRLIGRSAARSKIGTLILIGIRRLIRDHHHHRPIKRLHPVSNFDSWSTQLIRCQNASFHTAGVLAPTLAFPKNDAPGVQLICSSESAKFAYFRIILIRVSHLMLDQLY